MTTLFGSYPRNTFTWSNQSLSYVTITYYGNAIVGTGTTYSSGQQTGTSWTTGDLSFNALYTFTMTAYDVNGTPGETKTFTVNTTPSITGAYSSGSSSTSSARLQWYGTYYYVRIYRKITSPYTTDYVEVSANTKIYNMPFNDTDLSGNTTYMYSIQPYDAADSPYDTTNTVTISTNVSVATDLSAVFYDTSSIKISFTLPKNSYSSSYYYVLRTINSSLGYTIDTSGTTSPLFARDLSDGTTYTCYILSYLDDSLGSTSSGYSVTTSSGSTPTPPTVFTFYITPLKNFDTFSGTTQNYRTITLSETGQYIFSVFADNGGGTKIAYSADYGATWTKKTNLAVNSQGPMYVTCSWSGQYVFVYGRVGTYGYSLDYGATWAYGSGLDLYSFGLCSSSSGQYVFASNSGSIYYSTNYGATFTAGTGPGGTLFNLRCSPDGKYFAVLYNSGTTYRLYTTQFNTATNTFSTAVNTGLTPGAKSMVAISQNGTYILVSQLLSSSYYWYLSSNGGTSFSLLPSPVNGGYAFGGCGMSYTGQYMAVGYSATSGTSGGIYYSADYGASWTLVTDSNYLYWYINKIGAANSPGITFQMSPDGSRIMCNNFYNNPFYLCTTSTTTNTVDITTGLTWHYKFETADINANKLYNHANGTYDATLTSTGVIQTNGGVSGGCFYNAAAASNTYITLPALTITTTDISMGYSVSYWFKLTAASSGINMHFNFSALGQMYQAASPFLMTFGPSTGNYIQYYFGNGHYNTFFTKTSWNHVAMCYNYSTSQTDYYLNGVWFGSSPSTFSGTTVTSTNYIAGTGNLYNYIGYLDSFRFYKSCLNKESVKYLYDNSL
jgi:hypothetical protein